MKSILLFLFLITSGWMQAQLPSIPPIISEDTTEIPWSFDSSMVDYYSNATGYTPQLFADKPYQSDVQQYLPNTRSSFTIILLTIILLLITYLKIAFGNTLEELFQSVWNRNIAQQIFRSQSGEFTFSSLILHANFIVIASLYLQFVIRQHFHQYAFQKFSAMLFLIFLFTFFYVGKIFLLKFLGNIFEVKSEADEYLFHFTTICKTLGLTLFPALFVLAFTQKIFSDVVIIATGIIFCAFFLLLLFRGLSTARKFLYRNIYHFILYVCIAEALPMFLFFKLLTKTIT